MKTKVAAINPGTGKLEEKHVDWFKTSFSRHICLVNHDSQLGKDTNPWVVSLLRYWLKGVFVPVNRKFSVIESVLHFSNKKLSTYFRDTVRLSLYPGETEQEQYIRPDNAQQLKFRLPQMSLDASGLMMTRPDSFMPPVDIVIDKDTYSIYMDVPGLSTKDITLARQNVMTIIKGKRSIPYNNKTSIIESQERKSGDFTMTFNIPHNFERKWYSCKVDLGVLCIKFKRDADDSEQPLILTRHIGNAEVPHDKPDLSKLEFKPVEPDVEEYQ